jgi:hypothetical protein
MWHCRELAPIEWRRSSMRTTSEPLSRWSLAGLAAALLLLLGACADGLDASTERSLTPAPAAVPSTSGSGATPVAAAVQAPFDGARLRIRQHQTVCCYHHGQVSYLIVRDQAGAVIKRRAVQPNRLRTLLVDLQLAPGRYFITSYQRPCNMTCDVVLQRMDRCTRSVDIAADEDVVFTVEVAPGEGCRLV